jgi:hypothetical protein
MREAIGARWRSHFVTTQKGTEVFSFPRRSLPAVWRRKGGLRGCRPANQNRNPTEFHKSTAVLKHVPE